MLCASDRLGTGGAYRTWNVDTDDSTQLIGVSPCGPNTCMYELGSIGARFRRAGSGADVDADVFFHCSRSAMISFCTRCASEGNRNPLEYLQSRPSQNHRHLRIKGNQKTYTVPAFGWS